jgi:hypothetical protein
MEILLGLFLLWLGYFVGTNKQSSTQPSNESLNSGQLLLLQEQLAWLLEFQKLYDAGLISTQRRDQIMAWYYAQNSFLEQRLRHYLPQNEEFWRPEFRRELVRLHQSQLLSKTEYEACLAYLKPPEQAPVLDLTLTVDRLTSDLSEPSSVLSRLEPSLSDLSLPDLLKPSERPDVLLQLLDFGQRISHQRWSQALIGLGILSIVLSSLPVIQEMSSATLIYLVLLLYSAGLLGAGWGVHKHFPWTGQVLSIVTLLILPLDYASLISLDLAQPVDLIVSILALLGLPALTWLAFKTLNQKPGLVYFLSLLGLGWCSALLRGFEPSIFELTQSRQLFIYLCIFLPFAFVFLALHAQVRQIWLLPDRHEHNFLEILYLIAYLIFAALCIPIVYSLAWPFFGIALGLTAWSLAWHVRAIRTLLQLLLGEIWPRFFWRLVYQQEIVLCVVLALGLALTVGHAWPLFLTAGPGAVLVFSLARYWRASVWRWPIYVYAAILLAFALLGLSWDWLSDGASLLVAAVSLGLIFLGWFAPTLHWRKDALHQVALFLSCFAWFELALFRDWSAQTLLTLGFLSLVYLRYAAYTGRNLFSYIAIVTGAISLLSVLVLWQPHLPFSGYRLYAMALAWVMLFSGLVIQWSTPQRGQTHAESELPLRMDWWARLNADRYHPFRFQQRFVNLNPYLYSEPLYNLALLITSVATLAGLDDLRLTAMATLFYSVIFLIYPARLWIYFVIVTASDNLLKLSGELLPERYQTWSIVLLGLGWFFVGKLVEEVLEGRDRKRHNPEHEAQKRFAKPFFHGAIFINVLFLRYFFGDMQNLFSEEGWKEATQEVLPVMLTSVFYLLNLRVYVSKLWLYPGIISITLGLYFGLTQILPLEATLFLFTVLAGFWLWGARFFNANQSLNLWWQALIDYRLPELEPDSEFARVHLRDLSSPLWTFGLITAICSLVFSAFLIPWGPLKLAQSFELAFLTRSQPALLFLLQACNFGFLALLFRTWAHPRGRRLLWLDGCSVAAFTLGVAWLLQERADWAFLPVFLSVAALFWSGIWLLTVPRCSHGSQQVFSIASLTLMGLAFFALGFCRDPQVALISLCLLCLGIGLRIKLKPSYWQLYALTLLPMMIVFVLRDGLHWLNPDLCLFLALPAGCLSVWFFLKTRPRQTAFAPHFFIINLILLATQTLVQLAVLGQLWTNHQGNFFTLAPERVWLVVLMALAMALWSWLLNRPLHNPWLQRWALGQILLGVFLAILVQPYLLSVGVFLPWGLKLWGRRKPLLDRVIWPAALFSPVLLSLSLLLHLPDLQGWLLLVWSVFPLGLWGLFYGQEAKVYPLRAWLWWLSLLSFNLSWLTGLFMYWALYPWGDFSVFEAVASLHLLLMPFACSLIWLAWFTLRKQPDCNQCFYLGLCLLLLPAGLGVLISHAFVFIRLMLLLEGFALISAIVYAAFYLRLRAFLHVAFAVICLAFSGGVVAVLVWGHWSLRWGLFILAGLVLMIVGNLIQARTQELKSQLAHFQARLLNWR